MINLYRQEYIIGVDNYSYCVYIVLRKIINLGLNDEKKMLYYIVL